MNQTYSPASYNTMASPHQDRTPYQGQQFNLYGRNMGSNILVDTQFQYQTTDDQITQREII